MKAFCTKSAKSGQYETLCCDSSNPRLTTSEMAQATPDVIRSADMPRHPKGSRRAQYDAPVKSLTHTNPNFCTPIPKAGDTNTKRATGVFASV